MQTILAIALGGAIGSVTRHYAVTAFARAAGEAFPYGTLFVNVAGSLAIGLLVEAMALKGQVSPELRALIVTGFLGGFTTFSAFSLDVLKLAEAGQAVAAAVYVAASVALSLLAVFGGAFIARHMVAA